MGTHIIEQWITASHLTWLTPTVLTVPEAELCWISGRTRSRQIRFAESQSGSAMIMASGELPHSSKRSYDVISTQWSNNISDCWKWRLLEMILPWYCYYTLNIVILSTLHNTYCPFELQGSAECWCSEPARRWLNETTTRKTQVPLSWCIKPRFSFSIFSCHCPPQSESNPRGRYEEAAGCVY